MNNFKQIGIGLQNYHDTYKILPPAGISWGGGGTAGAGQTADNSVDDDIGNNRGCYMSYLGMMLPFVEQQQLFDQIVYVGNISTNTNVAVWSQVIPAFVCPSDANARLNYTGNGSNMARGNYAAVGTDDLLGANFWNTKWTSLSAVNRGAMGSGASAGLAGIVDGTANTLAAIEVQAGTVASDPRGTWAYGPGITVFGNNGVNSAVQNPAVLPPADNFNQCTHTPLMRMGCVAGGNNNAAHGAKSFHPGGCLSVFADGSTQFLGDTIDQTMFRYLRYFRRERRRDALAGREQTPTNEMHNNPSARIGFPADVRAALMAFQSLSAIPPRAGTAPAD